MDKIQLMKEKIEVLNKAARAYYVEGQEIMSNFEYDKLYDELVMLEEETGTVLAGSPTQQVGYEVLSELPKEAHPQKMLSLDKTKDREALPAWLGNQKGLLSWKLDGLTVVLTYRNGELEKAVTRGNGEVGEVITPNAKTFVNLPLKIGYKGALTLRGEAVISYSDFEEINAAIPEIDAKYKNPRNLCSGSVRQLNSKITSERKVRFYAFSLVSAEGMEDTIPSEVEISRKAGMTWLSGLGFEVVEAVEVDAGTIVQVISEFEKRIPENPIPSDGLVLTLDDIEYSRSLGTTAKFPRDSIAFKWSDQLAETVLREIEWSASRTGLINPIAVFDPVELEGTTVTRASLHNVSIMEELKLGIGDRISVYKANMIIPQIAENLSLSGGAPIPEACPVCGEKTQLRDESGVKTLFCNNPDCLAKHVKRITHFVSRDAMDIEGLSEMTVSKLIGIGAIKELKDIFTIENYKHVIVDMEGFGEKSFENLKKAVEKSRHTTPTRLLYALGIQGFGLANARTVAAYCENKWDRIQGLDTAELTTIDGIGDIMASSYVDFFKDEKHLKEVRDLVSVLDIDENFQVGDDYLSGLTFVITGSLETFANREELSAILRDAGAKVAGSVSAKTSYLINNDLTSTSGKNKKAQELGIPIINEETVKTWIENKSVT